jgi:hypothetical protein
MNTKKGRYKIIKEEIKKQKPKNAAYKLAVAMAIVGIITPTGIIIKLGMTALLYYLHKLKKSGVIKEDYDDIKEIMDETIVSNLPKGYIETEGDKELESTIDMWNNATWEGYYKPVVTYPIIKPERHGRRVAQ